MRIEIRYGAFDDALDIRRQVFMEEQGVSYEEEIDGRDESSYHMVVYDLDEPIACARFYAGDPGQFIVGRVAVLKAYRHRGIGHEVMLAVKDWAIEQGIRVLRLSAQDPVIPFYLDLGYKLTDEPGFLDANIPHHYMELDLPAADDK